MKTENELINAPGDSGNTGSDTTEAIEAGIDHRTPDDIFTRQPAFPPKPVDETRKQSLNRSLVSLAFFIGACYLVFEWSITYILIIAGVILIHELGHYLAMRAYKYTDLAIFFVPLVGAFASGSKDNTSQKQQVIVLLSGPLPGVLIGILLSYFALQTQNDFLLSSSYIFIVLNLFNLLPVMPLDGGRVLKIMFFENNELIGKVFIFISIALLTYYALSSQSYALLIVPFFLLIQLNSQSKIKNVRIAAESKGINLDKSYHELSDEQYWLIRDEIAEHMKYFERSITPGKYVVAENENKIVDQVKAIIQKKPLKDLKPLGKTMIILLWILTFIVPWIFIALFQINLGMDTN